MSRRAKRLAGLALLLLGLALTVNGRRLFARKEPSGAVVPDPLAGRSDPPAPAPTGAAAPKLVPVSALPPIRPARNLFRRPPRKRPAGSAASPAGKAPPPPGPEARQKRAAKKAPARTRKLPPAPRIPLRLVLLQGKTRLALVGAQLLREGDRYGRERVAAIEPEGILLEGPWGRRRIALPLPDGKPPPGEVTQGGRSAADKQEGRNP